MATYGHTFTSGDTVTPTKLNNARTVTDIVNADIKNDAAIAHSKLANIPSGQLLLGNGSNVPTATAVTGDVTISNAGVTAITAGSIVTADLADGAVTSAKIADGTIVNADVSASAAIAGTKIASDFGSQVVTMGNTVNVGGADSTNTIVNIGAGATGNKFAVADFIGDTTYTDFGFRVGRKNDGANGTSTIEHRGTGGLQLNAIDAGFVNIATSNTERMRIDPTGNVGIGTSSPAAKLDVDGSVRIRSGGTTGYALLEYGASTTATNNWHVGSEGDGTFRFYNGNLGTGAERMHITASGNVGIGTASPSTKLEVAGTITATAFAGNLTGTASAIADGTVSTAKIVDGAVTDAKIASGVDASKLTTGTLPIARIADAAVTPAKLSQPYTLATAQNSTSGTSIDFTGIPSWAKRITVMLNGVSTNGTSHLQVQLGDSGGFETTGYVSVSGGVGIASGFLIASASAANAWHGALIISLIGSNAYTAFGCVANSAAATSNTSAGSKTLSDTLTQIRITTVNGTDAFDAGTINISYEG